MEKENSKDLSIIDVPSGIFVSIKPTFTKLIESGEKNYEFRKYIPKRNINLLYVYESSPTCCLKYILCIDKIVEYPTMIEESGIGNKEFNNGLKKSKYAYHITNVYKLIEPIPLFKLKQKYSFVAPQSYVYDTKYPSLINSIDDSSIKKVR